MDTDIIGGFSYATPCCDACGNKLLVVNAWMTDGCPCIGPLGCNSMNETRWRLLMELQQRQSMQLANWQRFASYCRSCALSGEHDPMDFATFANMPANTADQRGA